MSNTEVRNPLEQILDETNQLIQISDSEIFSMMYANMSARTFTDHAKRNGRNQYYILEGIGNE